MNVSRSRVAVLVGVAALLSLGLTACSGSDGDDGAVDPAVAAEAARLSRERVQAYLDAMKDKSVDEGRNQLCEPLREAFDKGATGPNGDFADHFTVAEATVTDVRANGGRQEVSTSITVANKQKKKSTIGLLFTVAKTDAGWCIAGEAPGGNGADPSPAAS